MIDQATLATSRAMPVAGPADLSRPAAVAAGARLPGTHLRRHPAILRWQGGLGYGVHRAPGVRVLVQER